MDLALRQRPSDDTIAAAVQRPGEGVHHAGDFGVRSGLDLTEELRGDHAAVHRANEANVEFDHRLRRSK